MSTAKLRAALQWRDDVEGGELITSTGYDETHMSFKETTSQKVLDAICASANIYYAAIGSRLRIANSMGELIPAKAQREG